MTGWREASGGLLAGVGCAVLASVGGGGLAAPSRDSPLEADQEITFAADVAPLLHQHCAGCHRPGGSAPFPLLTYEDAVDVAPRMARAVSSERMPPWLPAPGDVAFAGDRTLTPEARETIVAWARSEHPPGDLSTVDPPIFSDEWALGAPDIAARTESPYPAPATGDDIFRNLVLGVPLEDRVWVRGMELRFNDPSVVHHAMITLDVTRSSRRMDAREPGPGFDGMFASTEALGPSGFLLGWTPGHEPALSPADFAFPLEPGTDIVLQLHLRPTGEAVDLEAEVAIHTAEQAPSRTPFTIRLGVEEIDIPPGEPDHRLDDLYELPVDVELLGLYPHAHFLGKEIRLDAVRPDSTTVRVLDIPDWNFNWQDAYRLASPLALPAGTRLEARFLYDNSTGNRQNPHDPPRRVLYGPRSEDEMGEIWIQVVPRREADYETLAAHFARHDFASKVAGWRHTLSVRPGDPAALAGLGTLDQARGFHGAAIRKFQRALDSRPEYVVARYNLALSLESLGRLGEAAEAYRTVLEVDSLHADAHNNLALLAARRGDLEAALAGFRRAVAADPGHVEARSNLGNALRQAGRLSEAAAEVMRALELDPGHEPARLNLALLAWTRATHPDPEVRDAEEAVRWAEAAARESEEDPEDPRVIDALAAAYAEAGRFEEAVAAAERAIERAREVAGPEDPLVGQLEDRRDLYAEGVPYRQP